MTSTWKAALGIVLIFVFGWMAGALSASIFFHHRMLEIAKHPAATLSLMLERRLTGNLGLDAGQKAQVHSYFLQNLEQRQALQKQIQPQVQVLNHETVQQILALLNQDQAQKFTDNIEKTRKRWGQTPVASDSAATNAPTIGMTPATNAPAVNSPAH